MTKTYLWLLDYLCRRYKNPARKYLAKWIDGKMYLPVDSTYIASVSAKTKTKTGVLKQVRYLEEHGYIYLEKIDRVLYFRLSDLSSPKVHPKFTESSPEVHSLLTITETETKTETFVVPSERPEEEIKMAQSAVSVFEFYNGVLKEYGYMGIKKPTEKEKRALIGMVRAFKRIEMPITHYIGQAVVNWERIRAIISDRKLGVTPTLTDLCVRRDEIMKTLSIIKDSKAEEKVIFSEEDLEKGRKLLETMA